MVEGSGFDPARLGLQDISLRDDALAVPACYAAETLLPEALPNVDDDPVATATGVIVAAAVAIIITIRSTGAVFAGQIGYTTTVGGILWSIILLNEQMTPWIWAAIAFMIAGVALVMPKDDA